MSLFNKIKTPSKKLETLLLSPEDHRGKTLIGEQETDVGVKCRPYQGIEYRIFKHGPAWSFPGVDRFLAIEGTPITTYVNQDNETVKCSVPEFLKFAWGDPRFYDKLQPEHRAALEGKWAATVTVEPVAIDDNTKKDLDKLKVAALLREHIIGMFRDFAVSEEKKDKIKDTVSFLVPF